ncbi:MAG TPA: 16S rRNA (cytosine(1402)-N(4))-methyltransferase RsmH [Gemmatimonadales bacterium]|jgi:16S rRNA (cytosine1402-N4)-methyltransferase|nr:16S rRNA (cytosine(1402)-N(4))-methyltransferase RsmH [Gemmatimonadales bacterium]
MTDAPSHLPVLLAEVMERAAGAVRVVDGTLGHGGHAAAFLAAGATVLGIDRDPDAVATARARLGDGVAILQLPFFDPEALRQVAAFRPDFVLLDLGVSSRQFDDATRGFTFREGAPLDMRMGPDAPTAAEWLAEVDDAELARVLRDYADEPRANRLARELVRRRGNAPLATSDDLVNAIRAVLGPRSGPGDFARIFQAVRIAVNDELDGLATALPAFRDALVPGGTLAVISYHSGEDRVVKGAFRDWAAGCVCPPGLPRCICGRVPLGIAQPRRAVVPSAAEIAANPRARSARLRFFRTRDAG